MANGCVCLFIYATCTYQGVSSYQVLTNKVTAYLFFVISRTKYLHHYILQIDLGTNVFIGGTN